MKLSKGLKKVVATLAVGLSIVSASSAVFASGTWYGYSGTVPVVDDLQSSNQTKASTDTVGRVNANVVSGGLVAWIESSGGANITNQVSYSTPFSFDLQYLDASTWKGKSVHLNISTSATQWSSVPTSGTWSPDRAN